MNRAVEGERWLGGDLAPFGVRLPVAGDRVELSYSVLDAAPVGTALVDVDGRLRWVNAALCRLVGRPPRELLDGRMDHVVHPEDWEVHRSMSEATASSGQAPGSPVELRWVHADGSILWVAQSISVATDPGGRRLRLGDDERALLVIQAVDVSARRAAEQAAADAHRALQRRNVELERSNRDLAEFASVVSHDLSEPLRVIAGHVELLARRYRGQLDAEADEWIGFTVDGAARMRALIDSLLAYARVGQNERPPVTVDTNAVAHAAVAGLRVTVDAASAVVAIDPLPTLEANPSELGRVIANLVANAVKFRRPGVVPFVRVSVERGDGEWRFVVADNGIGIPQHQRERVFRLFQRLHPRGKYEGTGIGLAICRKIVERGGGRVWIEESPAGGAAVWFTVPDGGGAA